jgi:hypothetical protein
VFVGPAALLLAALGLWRNGARRLGILAGCLMVVALGSATPLFRVLYDFLPGFSHFRATNRFSLMAILLITPLAGLGMRLLDSQRRGRIIGVVLGILAGAHLIWFAAAHRVSSDGPTAMPANWRDGIAQVAEGERVLIPNGLLAESGAANGFLNIAGSNPLVLNRTAKFLAAIQQLDPADVGMDYPVLTPSTAYELLRCGLVIPSKLGGGMYSLPDPLPRLELLDHVVQVQDADEALAMVLAPGFDARHSVVLETGAEASPGSGGSARIVHETSDEIEIEADVSSPQVLVITDSYSDQWRAISEPGSAQNDYQILPADYCLRAIPLSAGHHHLLLEYRPSAMVWGAWMSIVALLAYFYAICFSRFALPARWMPGRT